MKSTFMAHRAWDGLVVLSRKVFVLAWIRICSCRASKKWGLQSSPCFGFAVASLEC